MRSKTGHLSAFWSACIPSTYQAMILFSVGLVITWLAEGCLRFSPFESTRLTLPPVNTKAKSWALNSLG